MTSLRTWVISAAAVTGVVGGSAVGLSIAAPTAGAPVKTSPRSPTFVDSSGLQSQLQQLLAEDHALQLAVRQAKSRLASQVKASETSLQALQARLAAARAALAATQGAAASAYVPAPSAVAPASRPSSHTTTGASGASGSAGGDDGGSNDN